MTAAHPGGGAGRSPAARSTARGRSQGATSTRTRPEPPDGRSAPGAADAFFDRLPERRADPLVRHLSGRIRFDLGTPGGTTTHWYVALDRGHIDVSHRRGPADAVIALDGALFDDIVQGRANAMAAVLRGAAAVEGDLGLIMSFQRLFGATGGEGRPAPRGPAHDGPARRRHGGGR